MVSLFKGAAVWKADAPLTETSGEFLRERTLNFTSSSARRLGFIVEAHADRVAAEAAGEEAEWAEVEKQALSAAEFDELTAYLLSSGEASP